MAGLRRRLRVNLSTDLNDKALDLAQLCLQFSISFCHTSLHGFLPAQGNQGGGIDLGKMADDVPPNNSLF